MKLPNYNLVKYELSVTDHGKAYSGLYKNLIMKYQHHTPELFEWLKSLTQHQLSDIMLIYHPGSIECNESFKLIRTNGFIILSRSNTKNIGRITYWSYVYGYTFD